MTDSLGLGITQYEFADSEYEYFKLEDVLRLTELTEDVIQEYPEEIESIRELSDGTKVICEPGAYFLIFFVSESAAAKEMQDWLFDKVLPDIGTKGYYMKGE